MWKRGFAKNSIMHKMVLTVVAVLVLQSLLLLSAIGMGGAIYQLNKNALDILNERTINRKNYLENEMVGRWSKLEGTSQTLKGLRETVERDTGLSQDEKENRFLKSSAETLVYLLRRQSVTGAFMVLGSDENAAQSPGLYFRDLDPKSNPSAYSDLLMERGPAQIGKDMGISLDTYWEASFAFPKGDGANNQLDFYKKPLQAARQYPGEDPKDLGYWSRPFRLNQDTTDIITYSVPLLDEAGAVYGVLGVEISLSHLSSILPYQELSTEQNSAYLLGIDHDQKHSFEPVALNGPLFKRVLKEKKTFDFGEEESVSGVYRFEAQADVDTSCGSIQYLKLYNTNTPFEDDQWALIGMDLQSNLLAFSYKIVLLLAIALVVSLVAGIAFAFLVSKVVTNPVRSLVDRVLRSNPNQPVKFDKTHISEVDDLAASIEVLSQRVAASASKLSSIIELASVPIGAFEYEKDAQTVFCTNRFFEIFSDQEVDIPKEPKSVTVNEFERYMEQIAKWKESGTESAVIYRLHDERGYHKWVRLKLVVDQEKTLGVVEDITAEVQEKKKIEYERDYDLLTSLLNRRAFHSQMKELFRDPKLLKTGALVMLDLDNLKYINDTFGHDYGDQYIRCTAQILTKYVSKPSLISRMSGDEFYVFYYGYEDKEAIRKEIDLLQESFREKVFHLPGEENAMRVRVSAGVAWYPDDSHVMEDLIRFADFAMYTVKKTVKGAFKEFDETAYLRDSYLLKERENLNRFIEEELVEYYFQPIVNAKTGEVFAYEALMRPQMEGLRTPMEVLNLARSQSKLHLIERLTLFRAMSAFMEQKGLPAHCKVFVNSVANQRLDDADILKFEQAFQSVLPSLVVELTEEEKTDAECLNSKRQCAKRWGCQFALDDFGEGYNGEGVLLKLQPDYVKIDCGLVKNVDHDADRYQLVQNLVAYAKRRNILIIAEGVETLGELRTLVQLDVDFLQGYYIGLPLPQAQPAPEEVRQEILHAWEHRNNK